MWRILLFLCFSVTTVVAAQQGKTPPPPDYADTKNWAALPEKTDFADLLPDSTLLHNGEDTAHVDVFFIHPTTYKGKRKTWNADVKNPKLNQKTDETTIMHQASVFNGSCRIYAPRYRQAHIRVYYTKNKHKAIAALDTAYADVERAFEYYLNHYNQGRPIIIASHSQGSTHAKRLLQEFFDGKPLYSQLVVAYIAGMPIRKTDFTNIEPCANPSQTGCFNSWNTWVWGAKPKKIFQNAIATNPLNWTIDSTYADITENEGSLLGNFKNIVPQLTDAQTYRGIVWVHRPPVKGRFLFLIKNYHVADYNLFYMNIRHNATHRIGQFFNNKHTTKH